MSNLILAADEPVDIGHGVTITIYRTNDGVAVALERHAGPTGSCPGWVYFNNHPALRPTDTHWLVESTAPLTLSPSILCRACGHHGFIRAGRWVPA